MAGSDGTAVVPTTQDATYRLAGGALGILETAATDALALAAHLADAADAHSEITTLNTFKPVFSTLTADSADVNASVVLIASGLTVTLPIAGTYVVKAVIPYTTAAAADISLKFGGTATVTAGLGSSSLFIVNAPSGDATAAKVPTLIPTSWTTEFETQLATTGAPAGENPIIIEGKLTVTVAGTILLEFTQGTSDASNTHIDSGAYLMAQRVA